jgi:hypothetical protein
MPANGGLLRIGYQSPGSEIGPYGGEIAESLRQIFEIFPFSGDGGRRPRSICTAWPSLRCIWSNSPPRPAGNGNVDPALPHGCRSVLSRCSPVIPGISLEASTKIGICLKMLRSPTASGQRADVLVHPEQVARIVFLLQLAETFVIVAVGRLDACLAFVVHHEVRVFAATVGEDDVKLFKYQVKYDALPNGKKWTGTVVQIQVPHHIDFRWNHSNLEAGRELGKKAALEAIKAYKSEGMTPAKKLKEVRFINEISPQQRLASNAYSRTKYSARTRQRLADHHRA